IRDFINVYWNYPKEVLYSFSDFINRPDGSFCIGEKISFQQFVDILYENFGFRRNGLTIEGISLLTNRPNGSWNIGNMNTDSAFEWIYYFPAFSYVYLHLELKQVTQAPTVIMQFEDVPPFYGGVLDFEGTSTLHVRNFGQGTSSTAREEPDDDFIPDEDDTSETESDRSISEESEPKFIEEHPFSSTGQHVYREMGEWDPSCVDRDEHALPRSNGNVDSIRLGTVFRSKEEAQIAIMNWNVSRLREIQKKPEYSVTLIQEDVKKCWKVDVSYKKAWHGRKKSIDSLYGTWEENFAQLP
ncbi:Unknown protein, partial [Striga hermonthica]